MTKHNSIRFTLNELFTVRVNCKRCYRTIELPVADLPEQFKDGACPFCELPLTMASGEHNPFRQLAESIASFRDHSLSAVSIEFELADQN